jgi:Kef-type K+ transport system membrane component KefB
MGTLALIFAAALLGPALTIATRGAVPAVVGTLLAGLILGRTGLRIVHPDRSDLSLLYDLGFATLMFTVGMSVPVRDPRVRSSLRQGFAAFLVAVPLAVGSGYLAHLAGGGPLGVYAVVIVSSSAAVALPVIDETGLVGAARRGRAAGRGGAAGHGGAAVLVAIAWIVLADVIATIAVPLVIVPARAGHAAIGALVVAALVAAVFAAVQLLRPLPEVKRIRKEGKRRGWAIDLRFSVLALVTLSFVAQKVGASILIAGFGLGLVVSATGGPKRLSQEVLGLGQGFLVPLFFVLLGATLDLRALGANHRAILLAAVLAALAVIVHVLASVAIRTRPAIGLLATAQVGVPAAVIALGLPVRSITQAEASAIFCAALVSIGVSSFGAALLRRARPSAHMLTPTKATPARR